MILFNRIRVWRDRRHALIQLNYEIDGYWKEFSEVVTRQGIRENSEEFYNVYHEYKSYAEIPEGQRDLLLTTTALNRAVRWNAAVPPRATDPITGNEFWYWDRTVARQLLTREGHRLIRRAIAEEIEIAYRPVLSWAAIAISFLALVVSLFKP